MTDNIEQETIDAVNQWLPDMRAMSSGIEYGIALDERGNIAAFDEIVIPSVEVEAGQKVALVLASMVGSKKWRWYSVPL